VRALLFLALSYIPLWILLQQVPGWPVASLCAPEAALTLAAVMLGGLQALLLPITATLIYALTAWPEEAATRQLATALLPLPLYGLLGHYLARRRLMLEPSLNALLAIAATALAAIAAQSLIQPDTLTAEPGQGGAIFVSLLVTAALLSLRQHPEHHPTPPPPAQDTARTTLGLALLLALLSAPLSDHGIAALLPLLVLLALPLAAAFGLALGPRAALAMLCGLELLALVLAGALGSPTLTPLYQAVLVLIGGALPLAINQLRLQVETTTARIGLARHFDEERVAYGRTAHRLARTLHDDPMQLLTAAALTTQRLARDSDDASRETLRRVHQLIDHAIDSMRGVCARLSPPLLHEFGLAEALTREVRSSASGGEPPLLELDAGPPVVAGATRILLFDSLQALLEHYPLARIRFTTRADEGLSIILDIAAPGSAADLPRTTLGQMLELRLQALGGELRLAADGMKIRMEVPPRALLADALDERPG